ncbi:MAG: HAD family hydrolase [Candidatus Heimdallarchaeota archaeon]|nr:HAD family hydrolase [Candidatus Heimdallarchaeota archaeon]MCK4953876.1 HAD family hydrolase [Candidatus Heimdallarchaeota archaeon]
MNNRIPIFLDFGGTLVDTLEITKEIFKEVLGKDMTSSQMIKMYKDASKKRRMSMYMFFKYPVNPFKLLLKQKKMRSMQKEMFLKTAELVPGAIETLSTIKKLENIYLVLVTQNPLMEDEETRKKIIQKLFKNKNPFDLILAGVDKVNLISSNFDSETIQKGVIIGDLPSDVYVAEILKIPCYGVTFGYSEEEELNTPFIADDFSELYEMIKDHIEDLEEGSQEDKIEEIEFTELE